jgi:hypothetical protein
MAVAVMLLGGVPVVVTPLSVKRATLVAVLGGMSLGAAALAGIVTSVADGLVSVGGLVVSVPAVMPPPVLVNQNVGGDMGGAGIGGRACTIIIPLGPVW